MRVRFWGERNKITSVNEFKKFLARVVDRGAAPSGMLCVEIAKYHGFRCRMSQFDQIILEVWCLLRVVGGSDDQLSLSECDFD